MSNPKIAFIGAGNMAASIIGGLVAQGAEPSNIIASDPFSETLQRLSEAIPVRTTQDNHTAIADADIVVLAVKPQVMEQVLLDLQVTIQDKKPLIISIAAGIEISSLDKWLGGGCAIIRCMPNTPALVQAGATALFANSQVNDLQRQQADTILSAVGLVLWVEEETLLDAVTALSGSGPAYFFLVMEAMQTAGEELGLSKEMAEKLTLQTALGAAKMAISSDVDAAELRHRVTSPGGTTEQAIRTFEEGGLRALFNRALNAAKNRSEELARLMGNNNA